MMTVEKLSGIVLLLLFSSFYPIARTDQTAVVSSDFIKTTCNKFEEKFIKVCVDVIDSDPHQDLKLNLTGLLAIVVKHSIANVTDDYSYLLEQLKRSDLDKYTRQIFDVCVEEYKRGLDTLKSSLDELLKEHNRNLSLSMTDAFKSFGTCEDEFEDTPMPPSLLSRYLSLQQLMELCMGISNLLECQKVTACYGPDS